MKRRKTTRIVVRFLESNILTFSQLQEKMYLVSKGIKKKDLKKGQVSRGYACNSITLLVNSGTIKYHKDFGYFSVPGTSKNKYLYNSKEHTSWHRTDKDKEPKDAILHPKIKIFIDTQKKNQEIYI